MRRATTLMCLAIAAGVAQPASAVAATKSAPPKLVATVTNKVAHRTYRAGAVITVKFTVGEPGQPAGTGVPAGSVFQVQLTRKGGAPMRIVPAFGQGGRYKATIRWLGGRLTGINIGGFLNAPTPTAVGGFWLPVRYAKAP